MSGFVLDCSVAAAWLFEDEAHPDTDALLQQLQDGSAVVPNLWHLEIGNVLVQAERRGRISSAQIAVRLGLLSRLPIETDMETHSRAFQDILSLARTHDLTTYDAAYLELALRLGRSLATRDTALIGAASDLRIETLPD